jgi:aromatic-L-amino-acid decarboxylase
MLWVTSPACTELETHMLDWLAGMLDLPKKFRSKGSGGGVIQDTASSSSLCALIAARERATKGRSNEKGCKGQLTVYVSTQAHSSIEKAAMISGLGRNNIRLIDVDGSFAMRSESLKIQLEKDIKEGFTPAFVCATVGTTSSTAFDPIDEIGKICRGYDLWLHVDAAMAGTAAICPEYRYMQKGLEFADSYTFNPHKWMLTNFDCSCLYVADRNELINSLSILPEYLKNKDTRSGTVFDYRDWQIPLGRRFRSLKLWSVIRYYGVEGLRKYIRKHIELAQEFASWVEDDDRFQLMAPVPLNLVCFRHIGSDEINEMILDSLNQSGSLYLTHTKLNEYYTIRICIGQPQTTREHIEHAWKMIKETAKKLET